MSTTLSPLEEALFQSWSKANGVQNHDDPENQFDHRGLYKRSSGLVQPPGVVNNLAQTHNSAVSAREQGPQASPVDPMQSVVEHQKNHMEAAAKQQSEQTKINVEQMRLQHQAKEKQLDRDHKTHSMLMQEMLKRTGPQPQPKITVG